MPSGPIIEGQIMIQFTGNADRIRELLDRNLREVFGEGDDTRRRAAIDELWAKPRPVPVGM